MAAPMARQKRYLAPFQFAQHKGFRWIAEGRFHALFAHVRESGHRVKPAAADNANLCLSHSFSPQDAPFPGPRICQSQTSYCTSRRKKQAGKRNWKGKQSEQQAVEEIESRVTNDYGKQLLRKRGELVERSFAHCYKMGGMRRCTLRKHENILKRLLIHAGALNISLILRTMLGSGKPRELKNQAARLVLRLLAWLTCCYRRMAR
jgi:hypothetical protein